MNVILKFDQSLLLSNAYDNRDAIGRMLCDLADDIKKGREIAAPLSHHGVHLIARGSEGVEVVLVPPKADDRPAPSARLLFAVEVPEGWKPETIKDSVRIGLGRIDLVATPVDVSNAIAVADHLDDLIDGKDDVLGEILGEARDLLRSIAGV